MNAAKLSGLILILPLAGACSHSSTAPHAQNASSASPQADDAPSTPIDGSNAAQPQGEPAPAAPRAVESESSGRADARSSAAPAAARAGSAYQPPAEKKAERPGLGTMWGETRSSYVTNQPFDRADFMHPFALLSLGYNDEAGVQAMARRSGNSYASLVSSNVEVAQGALAVHILDENGSPLPSENFGGRDYVVGADGQRYTIQIENHSGSRFEAVATVDGLDVVDGKGGSLAKRGYLINPWATLEIDGFRRSQAEVAAFRFGAVKDSYAARKGNDRNVGVIGIAFFHERGSSVPWTEGELQRRESANPFPGQFAAPPPPDMAR